MASFSPPSRERRAAALQSAAGHYWTIAPLALHVLRPRAMPAADWSTEIVDPKVGRVRLSGKLEEAPARDHAALVVIVHGLGGNADDHYALTAARAAKAAGLASLRLNLRGADRSGAGLYHAGLTADLRAALASPALRGYARLHVVGYSMGGHLTLRAAAEGLDPRVSSVAAICPPLDLTATVTALDEASRLVYRIFILDALKRAYAALARKHAVPIPASQAWLIQKLRAWDERILAPWFGFDDAAHYYAETSVIEHLDRISTPALLVATRHDPMIPASTLLPAIERAKKRLDVRWIDLGGHVGYPSSADLGEPGQLGVEPQIMTWLTQQR